MSRIDFQRWGILAIIALIASMSHAQTTEPAIQLGWSHPATSRTPIQNREFHGPFGHEDVTVTADGLGKHDFIEISFDLFIMSSWDGSLPPLPDGTLEPVGPDYFRLGIQGGPTLLYHTFSNIALKDPPGFSAAHPASKAQSYPSQIPGTRLPPWTGASEFNTLGYAYTDARVAQVPFVPMDATYPIKFVVPHSDFKAVLEFNGLHLQDPFDENWGIANLSVRTLTAAQVKKPAEDSIGVAFRSCLSANPNEYVEAFQTLINGMDATADWIEKNVKPAAMDQRTAESEKKLQSGALPEIKSAAVALRKANSLVEPYLRDARMRADRDAREEIDTTLETLGVMPIGDDKIRQVVLATRVLEVIGTPRAMQVRNNLTSATAISVDEDFKALATKNQPTSRPWDMHFGDATLSLVGVSEYSNDPATAIWWAADGSLTTVPPVEVNVRKSPSGGRFRRIAIAFHASGPSVVNPRVFPSPTMGTGGSSIEQNGVKDGYLLFSFSASPENPTANILVRFGNGPPNKSATYDFDFKTMATKASQTDPEFELLTARQINASIFELNFNPPDLVTNLDWDVVLIDTHGQRVIHESQNGQGQLMGKGMLYNYRTSADQIKQIIYDRREWQVMQLRDVSLYPSQTTHPSAAAATGWRTSGRFGG